MKLKNEYILTFSDKCKFVEFHALQHVTGFVP